jgi:pimeloyl-ACP methyl ester carboxylesterase
MGRSLGSHPALELGANGADGFAGLIIESGASNLTRLFSLGGVNPESPAVVELIAGHEAKVRSIRLPVLIIHGEFDDLIPLERAAELYERLEGAASKEMVVIPGAGHNDLLWLGVEQYFEAIGRLVAGGGEALHGERGSP